MEEEDDCGVGIGGGVEEPVEEPEEEIVLSFSRPRRTGRGERRTGISGDCGMVANSVVTGGECGDGERELEAPPSSLSASASTSEVSSPETSSSGKRLGVLSSDKRLSLVDEGSRAGESARDDRPGDAAPMKDVTVFEKSQESIEALERIEGCFRRSWRLTRGGNPPARQFQAPMHPGD